MSRPRFWGIVVSLSLIAIVSAGVWLVVRGREARTSMAQLQVDGTRLRRQLAGYDLAAAGPTLTRVRTDAERAHRLTGDPIWWLAGSVPVAGRNLRAAREVSSVLAQVTSAAQPMETALPQLDSKRTSAAGGRIDTAALSRVSDALPQVSAAVSAGAITIGQLDPSRLNAQISSGVITLNEALASSRGPLADAVPVLRPVPSMLGANGPRSWMVLLQQDAEARGTGGLVGSYALISTDHGKIKLVSAKPRATLEHGPAIPAGRMPAGLRSLWGSDLTEWAGLNASPNFPSTGQLVAAGWKARPNSPPLNYVAGVDQYVVAAMLAATGPVTVHGVRVDANNAVDFLSRGVYQRWSDPREVDQVTTALVQAVFARFTVGKFNLRTLVTAMREPLHERRLLLWAADHDEQQVLQPLTVSGALPTVPGPFAMAVVNNGGGNKLDAYLSVHTDYQPGICTNDTRVGRIGVTLTNAAPRQGLPDYVSVRSDLRQLGITGPSTHDGSNRIILDIYGPVGGTAALTTVDGLAVAPVVGLDSNHPVWRVTVPIQPGQRRSVSVVMFTPVVDGDAGISPVVLSQPMVKPATASTDPLTACKNTSTTGG